MLRRLLAGLVAILLVSAVAATYPLTRIVADRATQVVYADRLADADRFATLGDRALRDGATSFLQGELRQYHEVYGIRAWLLGVDGRVILSADGTAPPDQVRSDRDVDLAERGVQPSPPTPANPFGGKDLLVAVPIGTGAEAVGAIVTLSPVEALRRRIALRWAALVAGAAGITMVLVAATVPFSRWLLRPVERLDRATGEIAAGHLESRVGLRYGPPELRRLASSFDRMAATVERTLQRQQQFVGDASHQLRTPLTSLRLALENLGPLLPDDPRDPARAEHAEALDEARAMGRVFDGLLVLTRLGADPVVEQDVEEVVDDAAVGWRARCAGVGLELATDVEPGLRVRAPAGGVRHLLDELVENACRLSDGGRVTVSAHRDDVPGQVVVAVTDDGCGLPSDQRAAATRRFWRAPAHQNATGSGLGLAIVDELVTTAGGSVELRDAGPGLAVVITLPAARSGPRWNAEK
jgi:signal transduction histidine kinase